MSALLYLDKVWVGYQDAIVLEDVGLQLDSGSSLALLGRNGMGKTTLLSTIMGAANYRSGTLQFAGQDISRMPSYLRAQLGIGWVPQERDIFPSLTVEENLTVTARKGHWDLHKIFAIFPRLQERRNNMGNQLSGGEQQMLAIGRALMLNPRLLLLDEPLEGLAPIIVQELLQIIQKLTHDSSMSVILVEQHARQILPLTQKALVLERGQVVYHGSSASLLEQPHQLDAWLSAVAH